MGPCRRGLVREGSPSVDASCSTSPGRDTADEFFLARSRLSPRLGTCRLAGGMASFPSPESVVERERFPGLTLRTPSGR